MVSAEIIATTIHAADAVRIAIGYEADVVRMFLQKCGTASIILFDRFGINATEQDVVLAVQGGNFARSSAQQFLEASGANAEKGFMGEPELGFGDEFEIDELFQRVIMRRADIFDRDLITFRRGQSNAFDRIAVKKRFNRLTG